MPKFEFIVSRGNDILLHNVERLPGLDAAWSKIVEITQKVAEPGARIRVRDENGDVAIFDGRSRPAAHRFRGGESLTARLSV